ncbi:MAG: hypothetical protein GXW90_06435 [Tepidanaerobacter acetatoxydans]|uniref:zinc ribbon domain-containing protein n=1 Tax=Tepidanaerobacter TaxID=499228 RepID=UPI000B17ADCD|nr:MULTISPECIES: C4-type zinc ribbon domain-containing protein [Tepidanaerobacter]NLU10562.1 hypothetical protein [Tepidanaerobacter acetatoxydans]
MIKEELNNLYKLQEVEGQCKMLEKTIKSHPVLKNLSELKKTINNLDTEFKNKKERVNFLKKELKKIEQKTDEYCNMIKQFEERIYGGEVTTIKELKILRDKQDIARLKVKDYEEKAFKMMEELDYLETSLIQEKEIITKKKKEYNEKRLKTCQEIDRIKEELDIILKQKQQLEASISPEILSKYNRIKKVKHNPVAMVLADRKCSGCMTEISVMIALEVEHCVGLVYCENCGRILL